MSKAFLDTTILTNALIKPGSDKEAAAKAALLRYSETMLPVYAIKEWKYGPLDTYAYVHDKLVQTRSVSRTHYAISSLSPFRSSQKNTSVEALAAAASLWRGQVNSDEELADHYRLAIRSLILRSWQKRRSLATKNVQDLSCYIETKPTVGRDGFFELKPQKCKLDVRGECSLAKDLKSQPAWLRALRDAIPDTSAREEDRRRRKVLKQLINDPKRLMSEEQCRWLGDAIFAFFCPSDSVVLTTNTRDHKPLAEALGKRAEEP